MSGGAPWQGYVNPGSAQTVLGWYNVKAYGAVGDGSHDDTAAIQAAVNAAATSNATAYLPPGTYLVSSTITLPGDFTLAGAGPWQSTIKLADGSNCDVLATANDGTQRYGLNLRDFGVDGNAAGQTSAGDCIHLYAMNNATLTRLYLIHPYANGIHAGGTNQQAGMLNGVTTITNCELWGDETNTTGHGIFLDTGSSDAIVTACDVGFFKQGSGIALSDHPGAVVTSCNCWQNLNGYLIYGVNRLRMIGCFSDLAQHYGFVFQSAASLPVVNVQLVGCQARDSGQAGAGYDGLFAQGVSGALVENVTVTDFQAFAATAGGISLDNYCSDVNITGGDVSGSDGGIALGTTGMGTVSIQNVRGFNPQGALTAPTVPASGTAYTNAFGSRCRVFVTGGTVTAVSIGGTATGLTSGTFDLDPGETITLTYTAAPTWTWFGL